MDSNQTHPSVPLTKQIDCGSMKARKSDLLYKEVNMVNVTFAYLTREREIALNCVEQSKISLSFPNITI